MIVPYGVLCHFSVPAVFRIAGGRNMTQAIRYLLQMWNQNTEKSPGRKMAQDFPPPAKDM